MRKNGKKLVLLLIIFVYGYIAVKQFDHQSWINWMNEMGGEVVYEIKWSNLKQFSNSYLKDGSLEAERQTVAERRQKNVDEN